MLATSYKPRAKLAPNLETSCVKWETNLNVSTFKTDIEKFYSEAAFVDRVSWWMNNWTQRSAVGYAPWLFRGYISEGLFQSVEEINKSAKPAMNFVSCIPFVRNR